jgi:hypothetical protein
MTMQPLDFQLSYVVMLRFLERFWEGGNEDLGSFLGAMCLSIDGKRSMDPAMIYDWSRVTQNRGSFTEQTAFVAAKAFLADYYVRRPLAEIKAVLDVIGGPVDRAPSTTDALTLWRNCWNEVSENARSGDPFKTAYSYGKNAQGEPGRFQRSVDGFLEFVPD